MQTGTQRPMASHSLQSTLYHIADELTAHEATNHRIIARLAALFGFVLHDQCPFRGVV